MKKTPKIKVVGIGGSGVNAINRMFKQGITGVELIAINTDAQSLRASPVANKVLLGRKATGGLGAGMNVSLGEKAARESYAELKEALQGAEMVFLTCGLGGGTGTSGIPILGEIAKKLDILTVAVVTLPFSFEGAYRRSVAQAGLRKLSGRTDTLLTIPNDRLLAISTPNSTVQNAFWICDGVLREAVKGISDLISLPGIINVDIADLKGVLANSGRAFLGIGKAEGEKRAMVAANQAMVSPLLEFSVKRASGILLNIAGGSDLSLAEVNTAATLVKQVVRRGTKIIFGVSEDPTLPSGELKVTVIATSSR